LEFWIVISPCRSVHQDHRFHITPQYCMSAAIPPKWSILLPALGADRSKVEKGRYPSVCADLILGVGAFRAMQLASTISMAAACGFCYGAGVDTIWPPGPSSPSTHSSDLQNVSRPTHLRSKIHPHPLSHPPPLHRKLVQRAGPRNLRWSRRAFVRTLEQSDTSYRRPVMPLSAVACKGLFSVAPASL
jgi:hypothetical protein